MVKNNIVAANLGIQLRHRFERFNDCLHKERHESELHPMSLLKRFLMLFP